MPTSRRTRRKGSDKRGIRHSHSRQRPQVGLMLLAAGLLLIGLWGLHRQLRSNALVLSEALINSYQRAPSVHPSISSITIGDYLTAAVVPSGYINGSWRIADGKANHVVRSGYPGTPANIIVYAHNDDTLFGRLHRARVGDRIRVTSTDGVTHTYTVKRITEVSPNDTSLLQPTETETLTLYTCSGWLDSKRFVVRATPASDE